MPRAARQVDQNGIYHVICRGNNKSMIFHDENDRLFYKALLKDTKNRLPFRLLHYVLMGNHVHLLIALEPAGPLSNIMKKISQSYAEYYCRRYGHVGHVWQGRYKNLHVNRDSYLLACGIYIEMNPVRANITASPGEFPWSSYKHYAFGRRDELVDDDPLYSALGSNNEQRRVSYQRLCAGTVP
jgi:putative transposase